MFRMSLVVFLLLTELQGDSEDSVHPEERINFSHDPFNPNMLQCPNTTVTGKDGDRVILLCSTKDKTDISHDEVEWLFKDPTDGKETIRVHLYFQGEDYLHEQSDNFKNRTSLFKEELSSGNLSLRLQVTTSHSGTYRCCVGGRLCCNLTLKVLPAGEDNTSQKHQDVTVPPLNPNNGLTKIQKVGLGVGIPAALLLIVIIALVYYYRERLKQRNETVD